MRLAIFLGALLIAKAIDPEFATGMAFIVTQSALSVILLICFGVMDTVEFIKNVGDYR